jgi:hypothetical protein
MFKALITFTAYVFVDIFGIDNAAVPQNHAVLFLIKLNIFYF